MIQFQNVSFSYSDQQSSMTGVQNIDLTIPEGQCVLLCGASGCGKSTLLKLINGLIPNYFEGTLSGSVMVNGQSVADTPLYALSRQVGTVFQNPKTQFFNVDVASEIVFGAENQGVPQAMLQSRLEETLHNLRLEHLRDSSIFELSGGEKQKVAFASVYHMNPDIYLLDEPSSNLDAAAIGDLKAYLHRLKAEGKTVVIAEHRLYYCMDFVDRVIYLNEGKIQQDIPIQDFRALSRKTREGMGLRTIDLREICPRENKAPTEDGMLTVRGLTVSRKKREILKDISFSANLGEIIGIAGENGAGKTTLLRTLCALHREYEGEVLWDQKPLREKQRCSQSYMVMQDVNYQLFADSVEAECSFAIKNPDPQTIDDTIRRLGLEPMRQRHPNTLSGGQKQRLAVAVSMVCGKQVLVFDEPTSGLDLRSMEKVSELIRSLARQAVVFVVTHDYEFLCETCTRMIQLADGTISLDVPVCSQNISQLRRGVLLEKKL